MRDLLHKHDQWLSKGFTQWIRNGFASEDCSAEDTLTEELQMHEMHLTLITRSLENAMIWVSLDHGASSELMLYSLPKPYTMSSKARAAWLMHKHQKLYTIFREWFPSFPLIASGLPISKTSSGREESLLASRVAKRLGCRRVKRCNTPFPPLGPNKPQSKRFANKLVIGQNQSISGLFLHGLSRLKQLPVSSVLGGFRNITNRLQVHWIARSISGKDVFISKR